MAFITIYFIKKIFKIFKYRKKDLKLVSVEFFDRAITFNWVIIFERKNIERANNRFRKNRARNIWQVSRFEKQKLQAPHSYFFAVKMIHASYTQFHNASPHFLPYISNEREFLWIFKRRSHHRPLAGKGILRSAFLNRARASGFYIGRHETPQMISMH